MAKTSTNINSSSSSKSKQNLVSKSSSSSRVSTKGNSSSTSNNDNNNTNKSIGKSGISSFIDGGEGFIIRPTINNAPKNQFRAYVSVSVLEALGLTTGQFCRIYLDSSEDAIVNIWADASISDSKAIYISKSIREKMGVLLGDRIHIEKYNIPLQDAHQIIISSTLENLKIDAKEITSFFSDLKYITPQIILKTNFEHDLPIFNVIPIPSISNLSISSVNSSISNCNENNLLYRFNKSSTEIIYNPSVKVFKSISYNSIGGLSKEIALMKSMIDLPLHNPQIFSRFGVPPPRGILLYGSPGTGKTILLKAVANESEAHVLRINGPSIVSKYLGESESKLRSIFEEARKYAPSIVFIDEIDALVPRRDSDMSDDSQARVVATLLTLMDGMANTHAGSNVNKIVVIAATNRPNAIDPALRRPGRFDREIEIGVPDANARKEILSIQLEKMPNNLTNDQFSSISFRTHGYVGADLVSLCREAVMEAIARALTKCNKKLSSTEIKHTSDVIDPSIYEDLKVEEQDFNRALITIRPSAMREVFLETPKIHWSDIGGQEETKRKLKEMVLLPLIKPEAFKRLGVIAPKGILLYGPPGCSKTLLAKALATEAQLNFLAVKGPELFNKFVGESERALRYIFAKARAASPSIIFFDEIDSLSGARSNSNSDGGSSSERLLTTLLNELDGIEPLVGVTILAATNRPDIIDSALLRPGRIDRLVYVSPPDLETRRKILEIQFSKMSVDLSEEEFSTLASSTDGMSGAELVSVCQEAGLNAMNENIDAEKIEWKHFSAALKNAPKGITQEMIEYYENFATLRSI